MKHPFDPRPISSYRNLQEFLGFTDEVKLRNYTTASATLLIMGSYFLVMGLIDDNSATDAACWVMLAVWAIVEIARNAERRQILAKWRHSVWNPGATKTISWLQEFNKDGSLARRLDPLLVDRLDRCLGYHFRVLANLRYRFDSQVVKDVKSTLYQVTEGALRIVHAVLVAPPEDVEPQLDALNQVEAKLQRLSHIVAGPELLVGSDLRDRLRALTEVPSNEQPNIQFHL